MLFLAASSEASAVGHHKKMPHCMSSEEWNRLAERLEKHPPYIRPERLPSGYHIGRCLFELQGKRLIAGKCAYTIEKGGSFEIEGPRQIYSGIDYPECFAGGANSFTTDHYATVEWSHEKKLDDGSPGPGWQARWEGALGSDHLEGFLGPVVRHGACFSSARSWEPETKICLWKK
jgi:hypothetical protein